MKLAVLLSLLMLILPGAAARRERVPSANPFKVNLASHASPSGPNTFDLRAFGAVGDGVADDGPALQRALNAIADAGGGVLLVPAGRYAIFTPVQKNFTGLAAAVTIQGVESSTPVPPPTAGGNELTHGLDLVSEFAPRTGEFQNAITISGLETLLIKDLVFIGTPDVDNDALITLALSDISSATIRHCEFYGLSSLVGGGAIVEAVRSDLTFEQSVVLGSACSSGVYSSIIQNREWKGITISDAAFADYGQRPELYGKMDTAPFSWVNIGHAAARDNDSPRREAVIRNVFFDEGGYMGLTSVSGITGPPAVPIDLLYVTGIFMNVSNFGTTGHYLDRIDKVLIEKSHFGWSHNAGSAIELLSVGNAIIDETECVAGANRIAANSATGKLTLINSTYTYLDSQAQATNVVTTETTDEDPVQHVREQFLSSLGRAPEPAAHFFWSDQILQCGDDTACVADKRAALASYLASTPEPQFSISGRLTDANGTNLSGVLITLSGAHSVTTTTDNAGQYFFSKLPTSGVYTVTPTLNHYTLNPSSHTIITPAGDQLFDSVATFNHHSISGRVTNAAGAGLEGVSLTLSGAQSATMSTGVDGAYVFENLPAGANYSVSAQKTSYTFVPASQTFPNLGADQNLDFAATYNTYTISGIVVGGNNTPFSGVTVTLSGSQNGTTTTDSSGTFSFTALPAEGNYTVTPSFLTYTFGPSSRTFNNLSANQYDNYLASYTTHTVNGRVTDASSGTALSGAVIAYSGLTNGAVTTDANGNYVCVLAHGGSYTLTVAKAHYTFASPSQTFNNLTSNQTADFAGTLNRHSIAGRAATSNGSALAGVTMTLSGAATFTATTDSNGAYSFANLPAGGNYTVKATKPTYSWNPPTLVLGDLGADAIANFTGTLVTHNVGGRVTENGTGVSGVSLLVTGSQTSATTTDATGNYSFSLPSEGSYIVTPSKQHYTFIPATLTFNNLVANQTGDFAATVSRHSISGRVINVNNAGVSGIVVSLSGSQAAAGVTDANGNYTFANLPGGGNYSVAPSLQYHSFSPVSQSYTNLGASQQVSFIVSLNTHSISGRVNDANANPLTGATVALSGSLGPITSVTTGADGNYSFGSLAAGSSYLVTVSKPGHIFNPVSRTFAALSSNQTADFTTEPSFEFSAANYGVSEGAATITLTVTRSGNASSEAFVTYSASNGTGTQGKDIGAVIGQLHFAPAQTSQTFNIFITDDAFVEGAEQLTVTLSDPQGAVLGNRTSATVTINDNDSGSANPNPVDDAQFFVRQHYRDFLNREPDAAGLAFWANQIAACGTNAACLDDRRINVSAAFFLSIEFQETGFMVHRLYKASFARAPQYLNEFLLDARALGQGVVVDAPGWQQTLENNKLALLNDFVERPAFTTQYPLNLTPAEFVNLLSTKAGSPLSAEGLSAAVAEFNGATTSADTSARTRVLRQTAESQALSQRELSPAFVLMQYFGYLQRNPNDLPDTNLDGYNFWLAKLNEFGGDFRRAQMVKSFLVAGEYRNRFGL